MAFHFNWSPLIADTSKARDMLTSALNKSPKPPIIVGDIIVTDLNLGSVPPELEILEIGDLAEDRFRGIFKMAYTGDAVLTLTTRVQANPLNTYLSTRPSFVSPQPLAASSGLTIPLQITLSDIRLSGFVILVFSKQKGITLVFRNDPLESLKVSSTFDSIPFVRDYLQSEIEGQLRVLFMEDLPAIIHRLSLQLWSPDHHEDAQNTIEDEQSTQQPVNPFASPSVNPYDAFGRLLDEKDLAALAPDGLVEMHATVSQKNMLQLAALTDSHSTLSLFTPPIRDAVFRVWAGASEKGDLMGTASASRFTLASLSHQNSMASSAAGSVYSFSDTSPTAELSSRPSYSALSSAYAGSSSAATRSRTHNGRRRKHRVIDLRRQTQPQKDDDGADDARPPSSESTTAFSSKATLHEREEELVTPPTSPEMNVKTPLARSYHQTIASPQPQGPPTLRKPRRNILLEIGSSNSHLSEPVSPQTATNNLFRQGLERSNSQPVEKVQPPATHTPLPSNGSILEQAWMMKMANDTASRVQAEKNGTSAVDSDTGARLARSTSVTEKPSSSGSRPYVPKHSSLWNSGDGLLDEPPPPAYAA